MSKKVLSLALALVTCLGLISCGSGGTKAATMHLRKTEGTVGVSDGEGKGVEPRENLGLYSGYGVDTSSESYAWIDLDDVKLTKMDQDSEIAITKEGKKLDIEVKAGSLFFSVTQPLADDETMSIRTSSMVVGIRGTCGWVEVDGNEMTVYIIEGVVTCSISDEDSSEEKTDSVSGGEMARMTLTPDAQAGERCRIIKEEFTQKDVPTFVWDELDEVLITELRTEDTPPTQTGEPPENPTGNSTVMDKEGNIYTLSNPILYTFSQAEAETIDMTSMEMFIEDVPYDESYFGPAYDYLTENFWSKMDIVYALPEGTVVTLPDNIVTWTLFELDIAWEDNICRADEFDAINYPGLTSVSLNGSGYILGVDLRYAESDSTAGMVFFYVPEDVAAPNQFSASSN